MILFSKIYEGANLQYFNESQSLFCSLDTYFGTKPLNSYIWESGYTHKQPIDMKRAFLFLLIFIVHTAACAQSTLPYLIKYPMKIIEGKWENHPTDKTKRQLNYYNSDKCPYHLYVTSERTYFRIYPGKTTVLTKNVNDPSNLANVSGTFRFYRGIFPKEFNPAFVYAMPVSEGKSVEWLPDSRERVRTFLFRTEYRDTVYAARSGMVCSTGDYKGGLLIWHKDDTFAAYLSISEPLVFPGERVVTGEPVALASHGGVSLSVFFLDENLFEGGLSKGYAYTHFSPYFRTDKGDVKLEAGVSYRAVKDDALIMQEMTKGEKKRYLKEKK